VFMNLLSPSRSLLVSLRLVTLCMTLLMAVSVHARLRVVASTSDMAALVAEVGGEHVTVESMSRPNQDPHYVDPRPSLVVTLARADMLAFNGLDLEIGWLPPIRSNSRNAAIQKGGPGDFDASRYIQPMEVHLDSNRAMGDIHPGGNPHFLYDARNGAQIAAALGTKLAELAPENQAFFLQNAKKVANTLMTIAKEETARFAALAPERRRVVTYHRSLVYLLDWLGLDRPISIEPRPGVSPSPAHVARVLGVMRAKGIKTIVQERFYPAKTSETLARLTKANVLLIAGGAEFADKGELYSERIRRMTGNIYDVLTR
jgi:zinc/manganese transport system substrate-binding protein